MRKIIMILMILSLFFSACGIKIPEEQPIPSTTGALGGSSLHDTVLNIPESEYEVRGNGKVLWTMCAMVEELNGSLYGIPEKNINALNAKLMEDGYDCTLSVCLLDESADHYELLSDILASGMTDIVTLNFGINSSSASEDNLMKEGNLEELSDYLSEPEGQALRNAFFDEYWEAGRRSQGLYFIPNQALLYGGGYLAFNKEYFSEDELAFLKGDYSDLTELRKLLEKKVFPEDVYPLYWWNNMSKNADYLGYRLNFGVFTNYDTGIVQNPYDTAEYKALLYELHNMYQKGLLKEQKSREERQKVVSAGKFGVWLTGETDALVESMRDKVIYVPVPFATSTHSVCHIAVCKNAENKERALQLLSLLFTNPEYANILIYGVEDEDYQVVDGFVQNMAGNDLDAYWKCYMTGLYDHLLPGKRMPYAGDRKKIKDEFHDSLFKKTDITCGFVADSSTIREKVRMLNSIRLEFENLWLEKDFETAWEKASVAYAEAGVQDVVDELNRQIQEWMKMQ